MNRGALATGVAAFLIAAFPAPAQAAATSVSAGERIHTENSYKYAPPEFAAMLADAGFAHVRRWQDAHGDFTVFHAA